MKKILITFLILSSVQTFSQTTPEGVQIIDSVVSGDGCLAGQVRGQLSPDRKELSFLFDNFITESGTPLAPRIDKKHCVIRMKIAIPENWSMSLASVDYRGFANVEEGGVAEHNAKYNLNKDKAEATFSNMTIQGPFSDIYFHRYTLSEEQQSWSVCRARQVQLMIKISLSSLSKPVGNKRPIAMLTLDSLDTSTRQSFGVNWKPCEIKKPGNGKGQNGNNGPKSKN